MNQYILSSLIVEPLHATALQLMTILGYFILWLVGNANLNVSSKIPEFKIGIKILPSSIPKNPNSDKKRNLCFAFVVGEKKHQPRGEGRCGGGNIGSAKGWRT